MRRTTTTVGAKLPYPINPSSKQTLIPFSTSSFGRAGDGRGRGRAGSPPHFDFSAPPRAPGQPSHAKNDSDEPPPPPKPQETSPLGCGHGRGRGKPLTPPSPVLPSFSGFVSSARGRGRGGVGAPSFTPVRSRPPPPLPQQQQQQQEIRETEEAPPIAAEDGGNIAEIIASLPPGAGRGQPQKQLEIQPAQQVNRHVRPHKSDGGRVPAAAKEAVVATPKMSRDEAVKHAMEKLAQNSEADVGRGRGRRKASGRGRGKFAEEEDEKETGLYLGDDADGERFAQKVGPEIMSLLSEGFEEVGDRLLPSAVEQMHLEALDMNFKLEFEPEFLVGDIESNPDINEKPPIPLRDALEKAKPFLMAYENIQSQEEWEEVMKETMERVPLLKEIVDHYSGPGRVTSMKQHQELERVAKTLPASAPNSIKQFTERAVLSLQNNPGWGFHSKCQFMDKLVWRMSQHYK